MNVPRSLTRLLPSWRKLHKTVTICLLVSLLAGLIPPPLLTAVADAALPASVADAAAALLPDTSAAQAAAAAAPVVAPPASTLQRVNAAPLAQAVSGSNILTITKMISGTGSGPFDLTITGPSGYLTTTQIDGGQTKVLTGLANGVYTVTETSPGAGWTTVYTATPGTGGSSQAVVSLQNINTAILAATPISGEVFRDFNSDGKITANGTITDTGIADVTVTAYDKSGNNVGSATTDSNGDYTINPTGDGPYRVEFSDLPSGYQPTTQGVDNGTSTQFVTTSGQAGNVNFGVGLPSQYCEDNPTLATTCLRTTGASAENAVVSFLLNDTLGGVFNNTSQTPAIAKTTHATQSVIGAVYGLA